MTRSDLDRTRIVRTWLAEGSTELSPRVFDDVMREVPATSQDQPYWSGPWLRMSTMVVGAAAALMLFVAFVGLGLFGGTTPGGQVGTPSTTPLASRDGPTPTPMPIDYSYRGVGFIGLPPLGSVPSDPTQTEFIETFWRPPYPPYTGAAHLYADGRLIWNEYWEQDSTGWLQQTLTDVGIDLVLARAAENRSIGVPRLLDPALLPGELPGDAWIDQTVRPYVPSEFAACLFVSEQVNPFRNSPMTVAEKMAVLPEPVRLMLQDRNPVLNRHPVFSPEGSYDEDSHCVGMTTADARLLDAALRSAGFDQEAWRNNYLLEYHTVIERPEFGTWWLNVWFEPILPDGTITCSSCG